LSKAKEDGDQILGVIKGSAVNNDGHTMGLTTPNIEAQKAVIKKVLDKTNINPGNISYLEAHGTGTLLGDPIEIKAATEIYREYTDEKGYCAVGSVKSNIGHLMRAGGIASFIKVILMLQNKQIPATLNCDNPHPRFKFEESPFFPNKTLKKWDISNKIRIVAISSFGFGGTNCHMLIEEVDTIKENYQQKRKPRPLTLMNKNNYQLENSTTELRDNNYNEFLEEMEDDVLDNVLEKLVNGKLSKSAVSKLIT